MAQLNMELTDHVKEIKEVCSSSLSLLNLHVLLSFCPPVLDDSI